MAPNLQPQRPRLQDHRLWSGLSAISKRSFRSCGTSAFEADDERSSTDGDMSSRNSEADFRRPVIPSHSGHDSRPTSRKELLGWYAYAFAAETYVVCGIGRLFWSLWPAEAISHLLTRFPRLLHPHPARDARPREWRVAL